MPTEKEMKAVKKLTQAQKAYLVKRVDSIVSIKKQKINENSPLVQMECIIMGVSSIEMILSMKKPFMPL